MRSNGTVKSWKKYGNGSSGCSGFLDNYDHFGTSVAFLGDLDGTGAAESAMAVGAKGDDDGAAEAGAVWILFLDSAENVLSKVKISHGTSGLGNILSLKDRFGWSSASLGDLDGDGTCDLAVGAPLDDDGGFDVGAVYILFLNRTGTVKSLQKISATAGGLNAGLTHGDAFGSSLSSAGDLDGDGVQDLVVGAAAVDHGGQDRGAVYVLFLNTDGTVKGHQCISATEGGFGGELSDLDNFGNAVALMGDQDGDGLQDLAVGAQLDDDGGASRGAAWFLFLDCHMEAKATLRNPSVGGITNPAAYAVTSLPQLGGTFAASIDLAGGQVGAMLVGFTTPLTQSSTWGNLLVNLNDPGGELLGMPSGFGSPAVISFGVPSDVAYLGFGLATQAVRLGGGNVDLTNAQDLRLGW